MKLIQDQFSVQSETYAQHRPTYPKAIYDHILKFVETRDAAWDSCTGNGQAAYDLSPHFTSVFANDVSKNQLDNAMHADNTYYFVCRSEHTPFQTGLFNLITVAQSIHWLDFDSFAEEVLRTSAPNAILAIWGYSIPRVDVNTDDLVDTLYFRTTNKYWSQERRYVDTKYRSIQLPFEELDYKEFDHTIQWTREELTGYLTSWSGVQNYIKDKGEDPVQKVEARMKSFWRNETPKEVKMHLFLRVYKVR